MMLGLDPLYFMLAAPGLLFALYASWKTKSRFNEYSQVAASSRVTGAQAAKMLLENHGLHDVGVEETEGFLSDHYDPRSKTLRLSPDVYRSHSLSAIGVACHEAGHAMQHAHGYGPLALRSALVPAVNIGSNLSWIVMTAGFLMASTALGKTLLLAGVALFSVAVLFSLVTLPVEYDATARAKREMVAAGIVSPQEQVHAGRVLDAAFLTYVAAAVSSVLTLLYYLIRSGLLGGRRDE
jgi:Zn-dependent membrane protease YugP